MAKFAKGVSGNPTGRPKDLGDLREIARTHTSEAVQVLVQIMADASAAPSARVGAASAVLDRGWGRAPQSFEINDASSKVPTSSALTNVADLIALIKDNRTPQEQPANRRVSGEVEGEPEATPPVDVTH